MGTLYFTLHYWSCDIQKVIPSYDFSFACGGDTRRVNKFLLFVSSLPDLDGQYVLWTDTAVSSFTMMTKLCGAANMLCCKISIMYSFQYFSKPHVWVRYRTMTRFVTLMQIVFDGQCSWIENIHRSATERTPLMHGSHWKVSVKQ